MDKCNISASNVRSQRCPTCCQTRYDEAARRGATMRIHMMGKNTPGGVQPGMVRSPKPPVASPREALPMSGRELSSGEKSRERMLIPKKSAKTPQSGNCGRTASIAAKKAAMADIWMATAAKYLVTASVSSSFPAVAALAEAAGREQRSLACTANVAGLCWRKTMGCRHALKAAECTAMAGNRAVSNCDSALAWRLRGHLLTMAPQ
mmetsp:Transcript_76228/g.176878  ORF Transcript_76228/g.176878 Transcript_76228/m.176878 type:complete len:206 (-) Transcript_76228:17-634(-)